MQIPPVFKTLQLLKSSAGKVRWSLLRPQLDDASLFSCLPYILQPYCLHSKAVPTQLEDKPSLSLQIEYSASGCCTLFSFPSVCWGVRGSWPQLEDELCCTTPLCHGVQEGSKWHWETLRLAQMGSLQPAVTLCARNSLNLKSCRIQIIPRDFGSPARAAVAFSEHVMWYQIEENVIMMLSNLHQLQVLTEPRNALSCFSTRPCLSVCMFNTTHVHK